MSKDIPASPSKQTRPKAWKDDLILSSRGSAVQHGHSTAFTEGFPEVNKLPQSASDVNLPARAQASEMPTPPERGGLKRVMSETVLPHVNLEVRDGADNESMDRKSSQRRRSVLTKSPKVTVSQYAIAEPLPNNALAELPKAHINASKSNIGIKSKSSSSLSNLARRSSWIIGSRSPSPSNRKLSAASNVSQPEKAVLTKTLPEPVKLPKSSDIVPSSGPSTPLQRKGTRAKRPLSAVFSKAPTIPSLPRSFSTDRLPTFNGKVPDDVPDLPTPSLREHLQVSAPAEIMRKKDELWTNFRVLDSEYSKFITKPGTLKATIIRSSLLPFLKQYANHPSNKSLRAEDLDRRVNIMNKWWTALLEMLNGRNGQSVSASDRPAVLEGLTGIMVRPEWRSSMNAILPKFRASSTSNSSTSIESTGSDFLAESVLHNVRTLFVQNLLSQMAFVVDRMSLRSVPASVVTFCGKATAYAFFFCPGVADILVRLWQIPEIMLRRVLDEFNVPRYTNLKGTAEETARYFPAHLRHLTFTSLPTLMRNLRSKSAQLLSLNYIPWYGPWRGRWAGRDSDLFFGFAKQYHLLTCEFLPDDATQNERTCAPCAILVRGQLLTVMDATIHRASALAHPEPQAMTFDEILGADASAAPLPARAPNTARLMAENRLIMLLRDLLSDSPIVSPIARSAFAVLFNNLLKAATKRTSLIDHDACFILCDFLEESLFIMTRYYRSAEDPVCFLDWDFWLGVLKRLGNSNNTMTELRLYALVYSLWGFITKDEGKKRDLCLGWLLEENYAYRLFNHWCPMVRAYYQRLLVWRVARCDGDPTEIDMLIYETLHARLKKVWRHYLYKCHEAETIGTKPPSTVPASPAPGRKLLIVRQDSVPTPESVFSALMATTTDPRIYEKFTSLEPLNRVATLPDSLPSKTTPNGKRRWTFLRSLNPFSSSIEEEAKPFPNKRVSMFPAADDLSAIRTPSDSNTADSPSNKSDSPPTPGTPPEPTTYRLFKFSLEWTDRSAAPTRDRRLYPPRLPHTVQGFVLKDTPEPSTREPTKPTSPEKAYSRYCGMALAEWAALVGECQSFYERRRLEGVVALKNVETPTLGVETFRKPLG